METDFLDIARASKLAFDRTHRRLVRRGFVGEAARAFHMQDRWIDWARSAIALNAEAMHKASAFACIWELSRMLNNKILRAEINSRTMPQPR